MSLSCHLKESIQKKSPQEESIYNWLNLFQKADEKRVKKVDELYVSPYNRINPPRTPPRNSLEDTTTVKKQPFLKKRTNELRLVGLLNSDTVGTSDEKIEDKLEVDKQNELQLPKKDLTTCVDVEATSRRLLEKKMKDICGLIKEDETTPEQVNKWEKPKVVFDENQLPTRDGPTPTNEFDVAAQKEKEKKMRDDKTQYVSEELKNKRKTKNFIEHNKIFNGAKLEVKYPSAKLVSDRTKDGWKSGLAQEPVFIRRKGFGKVPHYIEEIRREEQHKKEQQLAEKQQRDKIEKDHILDEATRQNLLHGLKIHWEKAHRDYQAISLIVDSGFKTKRKNFIETILRDIEKDIELLQNHDTIKIID
ncbi:hypothetical protein SNEBB_000994 [Seison nebaliae]|nr:hypothetical protein SNEBB_000994 [Seison nebaliae]